MKVLITVLLFFQDLEVQKRQLIDMLSMHASSCVKNNSNARTSPTTPYNAIRTYEPTTFPVFEAHSPYIRPESANILASSYTCPTPINDSIEISSLETSYLTPQNIDEYNRPDSVLSIPPNSEASYITTDGYLPKATILGPIEPEVEYYEPDLNYVSSQQCHNYPSNIQDTQSKLTNSLNDGCLVWNALATWVQQKYFWHYNFPNHCIILKLYEKDLNLVIFSIYYHIFFDLSRQSSERYYFETKSYVYCVEQQRRLVCNALYMRAGEKF